MSQEMEDGGGPSSAVPHCPPLTIKKKEGLGDRSLNHSPRFADPLQFPPLPPPAAHVLTPTSLLHDDDLYFYLFYEHQTHIVLQAHVFFPIDV